MKEIIKAITCYYFGLLIRSTPHKRDQEIWFVLWLKVNWQPYKIWICTVRISKNR